jgi:hypothetical protein
MATPDKEILAALGVDTRDRLDLPGEAVLVRKDQTLYLLPSLVEALRGRYVRQAVRYSTGRSRSSGGSDSSARAMTSRTSTPSASHTA